MRRITLFFHSKKSFVIFGKYNIFKYNALACSGTGNGLHFINNRRRRLPYPSLFPRVTLSSWSPLARRVAHDCVMLYRPTYCNLIKTPMVIHTRHFLVKCRKCRRVHVRASYIDFNKISLCS